MESRVLQFGICICILASVLIAGVSRADTQSDLQAQIDSTTKQIQDLDSQITALQSELDAVGKQSQTLQTTIQTLTLSQKKLTAQISVTKSQIDRADLELQTLSQGIATTSSQMENDKNGIAATLRDLDENDESPLTLILLSGSTLSSLFDELNALAATRTGLQNQIGDLSTQKSTLVSNKTATQQTRDQLATLQTSLGEQEQSLNATISSQKELLAETKDQQSSYQDLLTQKKSQEQEFENDLNQYQSQLTTAVNTSSLPHPGSGVIAWPFSDAFMQNCSSRAAQLGNSLCITQYFGNTPFATQNPQIYNGAGHDGIDIGAPIGTPVQSVADGVVMGSGNTDLTCPNASYGKWILIKHDDGLASLYAHLSVIDVSTGQTVHEGDVIAYSGFTGYATGPHLHLTIFAADAVQISSFPSKGCPGAIYTMPVAPLDGYLNPLSYL